MTPYQDMSDAELLNELDGPDDIHDTYTRELATRFKAKCEEVETKDEVNHTLKDMGLRLRGTITELESTITSLRSELEQTKVARLLSYDRKIEFLEEELANVKEERDT